MIDGALVKLTIIPFKRDDTLQQAEPSGVPFVCPFNPEGFSVSGSYTFLNDESAGGTSGTPRFAKVEPKTFSLDIFLDGTGAASSKVVEVAPTITVFEELVAFKGDNHRPDFFIVSWGSFFVRCVLTSYTINYKLFRSNGLPLRAVISTSWKEFKPIVLSSLIDNLQSPDVTHQHLVREREHLTTITNDVYENPKYYLQVARSNNLNNVRKVLPGSLIKLYPLT